MHNLLQQIKSCTVCAAFLPQGPRPVVQASEHARVLIIGQAPGQKVHNSGVPWEDQSGDELRRWLGVSKEQFYDPELFALMPMGYCYPGKGRSGDLPPRAECAPLWHKQLLPLMRNVQLTLLIGQYAQQFYLQEKAFASITENVRNFRQFLPQYLPLVHPSPRNRIWQKKNIWFETDVLPVLQAQIKQLVSLS